MAPKYKLTYFNIRARGEPIRLLFVAAGVDFVDERITGEEWGQLKAKTPQGGLPILEIDGKLTLCQSQAIFRYLARQFGLYGKNNLEAARIDIVMETARDLADTFIPIFFEKDEVLKATGLKKFNDETGPKILERLEKLMTGKFAIGETLTAVDMLLYSTLQMVNLHVNLEKYPKLEVNRKMIGSLPKVKEYLDNRPDTTM